MIKNIFTIQLKYIKLLFARLITTLGGAIIYFQHNKWPPVSRLKFSE